MYSRSSHPELSLPAFAQCILHVIPEEMRAARPNFGPLFVISGTVVAFDDDPRPEGGLANIDFEGPEPFSFLRRL